MADEIQATKMAEESTSSLGILGILKESLQIPLRNRKLMVSITLFIVVPFCLLAVVRDLIITPLEIDLASKMANLPNYDPDSRQAKEILDQIQQETRGLVLVVVVSIIVTCVLLYFSEIATVYLSATTYTGKHLTLKELILTIRRSWKKPLITFFSVFLLYAFYGRLASTLIYLIMAVTSGILQAVLFFLFNLTALLLYAYLSTICMLAFVISVVEEDCSVMNAFAKAGEIIKGRRLQGFLLMLLLCFMAVALYLVYVCPFITIKEQAMGRLVATIITSCLECLVLILMCVASTVFYYKCTKIIDEETVSGMYRPIYGPVSTTED